MSPQRSQCHPTKSIQKRKLAAERTSLGRNPFEVGRQHLLCERRLKMVEHHLRFLWSRNRFTTCLRSLTCLLVLPTSMGMCSPRSSGPISNLLYNKNRRQSDRLSLPNVFNQAYIARPAVSCVAVHMLYRVFMLGGPRCLRHYFR